MFTLRPGSGREYAACDHFIAWHLRAGCTDTPGGLGVSGHASVMIKHPTAKSVPGITAVSAIAVMALVSACATTEHPTQPIRADVAPQSGSPLSGASPPGSWSSAATNAAATAGQHPPADTVDQSLVERGYKPAQDNGTVVYCQSTLTPEHFRETRCYTAEQIKAMDRDAQSLKNHLMTPGTCAGWGCH
jgi:hypothetical protein